MTSRRFVSLSALMVAVATTCTACAAESPDPEEIDAWMHAWEDEHDAADYLATATGRPGTEVTVTFPEPQSLRSVEFSCFGDGTMKFSVALRQGSSTVGAAGTAESVDCAASPHLLAAPDLGFVAERTEEVVFRGFEASDETAWAAIATG